MTTTLDAAGARAIELFDGAPRGDRFHVRVRWRSCPFPAIEREVPLRGNVLEVGCGHGLLSLYLALSSKERSVIGVDIDTDKIELARLAASALRAGEAAVRFAASKPDELADGRFDAIVISDVLYLLPPNERSALLDACVDHLGPEGVLLVKEADRFPRWKAAITVAQELLATRVLHITEGEEVEFAPPSTFVEQLRGRGLAVTMHRVDRGYAHPHVLIVGARAGPRARTYGDPP